MEAILGLCSNSYSDMIPGFYGSIDSIKDGNNTDAMEKLDFVKDKPLDCEHAFLEGGSGLQLLRRTMTWPILQCLQWRKLFLWCEGVNV